MEVQPQHSIFLSASVPHRPEWIDEAKPAEVEEAIVSLARAVFARQGRLVFGGHPSVSPLIASVAGEYFAVDPGRQVRPVVIFQSEFFRGRLPDETWELHRLGWAEIIWTPTEIRGETPDLDLSLETMRRFMLSDPDLAGSTIEGTAWESTIARVGLSVPRAMVAIGGMEGVVDESAMFLRYSPDAPVCCYASTGGAAARLLEPEISPLRMWPRNVEDSAGDRQRSDRISQLRGARAAGRMWAVEPAFARQLPGHAAELFGAEASGSFLPYALISQWLVDHVGIRS